MNILNILFLTPLLEGADASRKVWFWWHVIVVARELRMAVKIQGPMAVVQMTLFFYLPHVNCTRVYWEIPKPVDKNKQMGPRVFISTEIMI